MGANNHPTTVPENSDMSSETVTIHVENQALADAVVDNLSHWLDVDTTEDGEYLLKE